MEAKLYTESDLIEFGNFLLSDKRKSYFEFKDTRKPAELEERLKVVHDSDIQNFLENNTNGKD